MSKSIVLGILMGATALTGCATKEYVHEYVDSQLKPVNARIDANEATAQGEARRTEARLAQQDARLTRQDAQLAHQEERIGRAEAAIESLRANVREALERAMAASKLAEGKLVHEIVLTDDQLRFGPGSATLSAAARALLDDFAARLKAENRNVYIEIQGHTDSRGEEIVNLRLGQQRAESVRDYLNRSGGIPLHRMAATSYGEAQPIADNRFRQGREQNRRVALVVLQ